MENKNVRVLVRLFCAISFLFTYACCFDTMYSGRTNANKCKLKIKKPITKQYADGESETLEYTSCRAVFEKYSVGCLPNGNNGDDEFRILIQLGTDSLAYESWTQPAEDTLTLVVDHSYINGDDFETVKVKEHYDGAESLNYKKIMKNLEPETAAAILGTEDATYAYGTGKTSFSSLFFASQFRDDEGSLDVRIKTLSFSPDLDNNLVAPVHVTGQFRISNLQMENDEPTDEYNDSVYDLD